MDESGTVLWRADAERISSCELTRFAVFASQHHGAPAPSGDPVADYWALHAWSLREREAFWVGLMEFSGTLADVGRATLQDRDAMPGARWFEDTRLNYAENLLAGPAEELAVICRNESGERTTFTRDQLRGQVDRVASWLLEAGVQPGDVVAGFLPNTEVPLIAMLATAKIGAVWTSTSPEFGADGVVDRFAQARATVLIAVAGYRYAGKAHDCRATVKEVLQRTPALRQLVLVGDDASGDWPCAVTLWREIQARRHCVQAARRMPFNSPQFILYSSGTTGKPKAIVHGIGGTLLQHRKEHRLHSDIRAGDRVFFYTTCGWMMWNWLVSALASRAAVVLYDGSPTHPGIEVLWQMAEQEGVSAFGTSPRYLAALEQSGYRPKAQHQLASLRTLLSTGSPLSAAQFDFVYDAIRSDLHLASISGGTDIISCFCLGVPWLPVRRGEIQGPGLGMSVEVADEQGRAVTQQRGELICTVPFPSVPLGFLHDIDGRRYHEAYFDRFPGVWHHGDYAVRTRHGGFIILGRSDAVLNPGGVRIGTAEIYRQVEKIPAVLESLAIGQKIRDQDERVVLFVRLAPGTGLDAALEQLIRRTIRDNTTPRHVPARIIAVADLPRTMSGKLVELAVRNMVHGLPVTNRDALANPDSLELFRDIPELSQ